MNRIPQDWQILTKEGAEEGQQSAQDRAVVT